MCGRRKRKLQTAGYLVAALTICSFPGTGSADTYASDQRKDAALGHYARARAMLVSALAEFEQGRKFARPDMLIDSEEWRLSIISRTEELNRVLDPKPRVTRDGVRFKANPLMIRRERDRTPPVADGAKDNNTAGESARRTERQTARAKLELEDESEPVTVIHEQTAKQTAKKETSTKAAQAALTFPEDEEEAAAAPPTDAAEIESTTRTVEQTVKTEAPEKTKTTTVTAEEKVAQSAPPTETDQAPAETAAKAAEQPEARGKLTDSEEEEVSTRPAEEVSKPLIANEEEEPAAESKATTMEEKEDEVTREIERAIADRIAREKGGVSADTEDSGE